MQLSFEFDLLEEEALESDNYLLFWFVRTVC